MQWYEKCILELTHHNLFENTEHRNRFRDLVSCYADAPFFTKGLCKCMYLSSWDDIHFMVMLDTVNAMVIDGDRSLKNMSGQGSALAHQLTGSDAEIYRLATAFTTNTDYSLPDFAAMESDAAYLIRRALLAAQYIDELPDLNK